MSKDEQLRQHVLDELEFEPSINAAHIGVSVDSGVVILSGFVASYAEEVTAVRAARRVIGVKAIAQELEVRLPSDKKTADHEIAKRAVDILRWHGLPQSIDVTVERGVVTLSGEVPWHFQRVDAELVVHKLTGVAGVTNHIRMVIHASIARHNCGPLPVRALDVRDRIEQALRRSAEIDASHITVRAEAGRVILGGKVHAWYERDLAEKAAWSAPGVVEVQDHIEVQPWAP